MKNKLSLLVLVLFAQSLFSQVRVSLSVLDSISGSSVMDYDIYHLDKEIILSSDGDGTVVMMIPAQEEQELVFFAENYEIINCSISASQDTLITINTSQINIELSVIEIAAKRDNYFSLKQLKDVEGTSIFAGKKTEVILLDKIQANLATNNAREIYAQVAGLNIYEGSNGGIQLGIGGRGLDPNRTANFNTRQNGYDISADVLGYPENYYSPPSEAIEEIQILRGASSLQYGTQFGGLINFKLRDLADKEGWSINTRQSVGSFGLFNSYNHLAFKKDGFTSNVAVNVKTGDGYRPNSEFDSQNAFVSLGYEFSSKTKVKAELSYFNYLAKQAGGLTDQQFETNPRLSTRTRNWFDVDWLLYNLKLVHKLSSSSTFDVSFFGLTASRRSLGFRGNPINLNENPITALDEQATDGTFVNPRDLIIGNFNNYGVETKFLKRYTLAHKKAVFVIGAKFYQSNNSSIQGPGDNGVEANFKLATEQYPDYANQSEFELPNKNYALFAEHIIYLTPMTSLIPGVRYENIQTASEGVFRQVIFDNAGNPLANRLLEDNRELDRSFVLMGVGLNHKTAHGNTIYANVSQNYRSVTFSDIRVVNPSFIVDPDISDERGYTADVGIRGQLDNRLSFDIGAYTIQYNDRIGVILDDRANRVRKNIGNASILGLDLFVDLSMTNILSSTKRNYSLRWFVNTSFTHTEYTSSEEANVVGKKVEFVPQVNIKTGLNYKINKFSSSIQFTHLSEQFTDAQNSPIGQLGDSRSGVIGPIPAYTILDLSLSYDFGPIQLSTGINNLTNTNYFTRRATGYPGPGIIPSDGRSYYLTAAVRL